MKLLSFGLGVLMAGVVILGGCMEPPVNRSYTNTKHGFSFDPPAGWQPVESDLSTVAVWFSPQNFSNVSLVIGVPFPLSEGRALSTFADEVEEGLVESGMNHSVLYRKWRAISNVQAYEIAYVYENEGVMEYVKQVVVLKTRTVFLITFFAPSLISGQFLSAVEESIDTFL